MAVLTKIVEVPKPPESREGPDTRNYRVARTAAGWTIFFIGVIAALMGLVFAGFEVYHAALRTHPIDIKNLSIAAVFVLAGGLFIQTQSMEATIQFLTENVPLLNSRRAGGKRITDPPKEDK